MRLVHCGSVWETLRWTLHAWWHAYSVPTDRATWTSTQDTTIPYEEEIKITAKRWALLTPFFASRGYHLYEPSKLPQTMPPSSLKPPADVDESYPYARRRVRDEQGLAFLDIQSCRVWAARDNAGREVIIKMVSFGEKESDELKIYRRLNTPGARADPRNRTLPVIDYITYDGLVFVVTPRWGEPVVGLSFSTVEQLLLMTDQLLEGMVFLHQQRIAHRDVDTRNMVMNALFEVCEGHDCDEIRDPSAVRYAYIDFEASAIFSMDTDIDKVVMKRERRFRTVHAGLEGPESNPFADDIYVLIHVLQRWVRVVENVVPEMGVFFDEILSNYSSDLSAIAVLSKFRQIRAELTAEQLKSPTPGRLWHEGKVKRHSSSWGFKANKSAP
ncbi:other/AgaK1 protein kinase [Coprinopsis cinerea AmutBmut pab1-1]|nr:other/AgaK1 protein kinase [Coprinopsis cinerea AmutBmut pab1-1]